MSKLEFKVGKKYRTRGGEIVECVAVWSKPNRYGLQVTVMKDNNSAYGVNMQGSNCGNSEYEMAEDVVEQIPDIQTIEGYITVFPGGTAGSLFYATEEECKELTEKFGVKVVKVSGTYEVSE